jgi:hypothetical protein
MLETLLNGGWDYHDTQSERLARELEAAAAGVAPALLAPFLELATHTIGEHLRDWPRALALGKRVLEGHAPIAETAKAWERLYVAAVLAADLTGAAEIELTCLKVAGDAIASLLNMRFMLANALVGAKRNDDGARLYRSALDFAGRIEGSPHLHRSIAVASNNLGWTLYEMPSRTAEEEALMRLAADASLTFWGRCGTWINEERALYLKSLVALVAGDAQTALTCAEAALAVIAANGDRPLDAARLHLARAGSLAALGHIDGRAAALADADTAAGKLTSDDLKRQFAVERTSRLLKNCLDDWDGI